MKQTLAVAVVVLASVACSSSSAASNTGGGGGLGFTAAELCALVTPDQVGAALGRSVPAGVPSGVNAPSCTWTASDASGATIAASDTGSVGKLPFGLQNNSGAHVTAIPNLGDAAYYAAPGGDFPGAELDLKKGGRAITITAAIAGGSMTQAQQEAVELAIAQAAVAHM